MTNKIYINGPINVIRLDNDTLNNRMLIVRRELDKLNRIR